MAGIPRLLNDAQALEAGGLVICPVSFATNGTSAIDATSIKGDFLTSVAYTATGVYTLTVKEFGYSVIACQPSIQLASAADLDVNLTSIDTSAGTVTLQVSATSTGSAAAPPSANANNRIHCVLFMQKGSASRHRT